MQYKNPKNFSKILKQKQIFTISIPASIFLFVLVSLASFWFISQFNDTSISQLIQSSSVDKTPNPKPILRTHPSPSEQNSSESDQPNPSKKPSTETNSKPNSTIPTISSSPSNPIAENSKPLENPPSNPPAPSSNKHQKSSTSIPPADKPTLPSIIDQARQKRQYIEQSHQVKIFFEPTELQAYQPKRATLQALPESKMLAGLNDLEQVLKLYPKGFFQEFRSQNMPLSFYIAESVSNNIFNGFFDYQFLNDLKLTVLHQNILFSLTTNHEIMHAIDTFLDLKMYGKNPNNPYDAYKALNPSNFSYSHQTNPNFAKYILGRGDPTDTYFSSAYGQINPREDRAEVFKLMMHDRRILGAFSNTPHLTEKARLIAQQIRSHFKTVNDEAHWYRFIR